MAKKLGCNLEYGTRRFSPRDPCGRIYSLGLWKGFQGVKTTKDEYHVIQEKSLTYDPWLEKKIERDSTLIGYFQCEKYFSEIRNDLLEKFVPNQPLNTFGGIVKDLILKDRDNSIFLTVRRTDYLTSPFHGVLGMDYYKAALDEILKEVKNPRIYIFSDDPEWCESNFRLHQNQMVAGTFNRTIQGKLGREDQDLCLMSLCKHAILANSSFSWWGNYLNRNPGVVVAPKQWFLSEDEDPKDIYREGWIKI
jgi:hypothetical protein